jgi:DNA repair exonuclease SbcCD ATPase subunit
VEELRIRHESLSARHETNEVAITKQFESIASQLAGSADRTQQLDVWLQQLRRDCVSMDWVSNEINKIEKLLDRPLDERVLWVVQPIVTKLHENLAQHIEAVQGQVSASNEAQSRLRENISELERVNDGLYSNLSQLQLELEKVAKVSQDADSHLRSQGSATAEIAHSVEKHVEVLELEIQKHLYRIDSLHLDVSTEVRMLDQRLSEQSSQYDSWQQTWPEAITRLDRLEQRLVQHSQSTDELAAVRGSLNDLQQKHAELEKFMRTDYFHGSPAMLEKLQALENWLREKISEMDRKLGGHTAQNEARQDPAVQTIISNSLARLEDTIHGMPTDTRLPRGGPSGTTARQGHKQVQKSAIIF